MPKLSGHIAEHFGRESDPVRVNAARRRLRTDPSKALIELKWLAAKGSVMSMLYLGEAYDQGTAIEKNTSEAIEWYKRAAAAGSPIAEHLLARAYLGLTKPIRRC